MKKSTIFLAIFLLGLTITELKAQWQLCLIPAGGNSSWSVVRKDSSVLAGVFSGIYFSDDSGSSWTLKNFSGSYARNMVVKDSLIFTTADYDGVYKSADNGGTWLNIDSGLTNPAGAWSLIQNDSLLILGTSGSFVGDIAAIYVSSDDGNSWTNVFSLGMYDVFYSFAVSGNELFAGVLPSGLFYSNDKGITWTLQNSIIAAKHIAMSDTNLLCGIGGPTGGIYLSTDKGISWVNVLPVYYCNAFATAGNFTYAGTTNGFYYSTDHGLSWINDNYGLPPATEIISVCVTDTFIFIGTGDAEIYRRNIADIGTGTSDIPDLNSGFNIAPNPSTGIFKINLNNSMENGTVEIYNVLGRKLFDAPLHTQSTMDITLKNIPPGIYFVKVFDKENSYCKKIIISGGD